MLIKQVDNNLVKEIPFLKQKKKSLFLKHWNVRKQRFFQETKQESELIGIIKGNIEESLDRNKIKDLLKENKIFEEGLDKMRDFKRIVHILLFFWLSKTICKHVWKRFNFSINTEQQKGNLKRNNTVWNRVFLKNQSGQN